MVKKGRGKKRAVAVKPRSPDPEFDVDAFCDAIFGRHTPDARLADPRQWQTEIPELRARPLTREDHKQVTECMSAIDPVLARGATVAMRMEFAAAMMASACSTAYESAEAQGVPGRGPDRFASAEDLILRRARELYAQGCA